MTQSGHGRLGCAGSAYVVTIADKYSKRQGNEREAAFIDAIHVGAANNEEGRSDAHSNVKYLSLYFPKSRSSDLTSPATNKP